MTRGFDQLAAELQTAERRLVTRGRSARARAVVLPLATTAVVAVVVAIVVLTGSPTRHGPGPGGGPAASPGQSSGGGRAFRLRCSEIVGTQAPQRGLRVLLGVVALPGRPGESRALQTGRDRGRLFAKSGLWVRNGARVQLTVAAPFRSRVTMTWGSAGEGNHGAAMTDAGCRFGHTRWINFVGGYWVHHPLCAELLVTSGGHRRRVRIGIGAGCPGQRPPPAPTQR